MPSGAEVLERWPSNQNDPDSATPASSAAASETAETAIAGRGRLVAAMRRLRWAFAVYAASRLVYLVLALVDTRIHTWSLGRELSNWDGLWYLSVAAHGYGTHVSHIQSNLGFFPLYPLAMWLVAHLLSSSLLLAGVLVSTIGGFAATVLIQRLSAGWWGEGAGKRVVLFFCLFPGSIVFSMVYAEGMLIALVAGCLLALDRRRWVLAGLLAGLATGVGPQAFAIIPACALAAALEIRRRGWRDPQARRALAAPVLAPLGAVAFGAFLWARTGSPFAGFTAQRYGWDERTDPLALLHQETQLAHQITHSQHINLNDVAGLLGAVFLLIALVQLITTRPRVSPAAFAWVLGMGFLTVTSENVPPNPRMLIAAFPALAVVAYRLRGRAFHWLIAGSTVLLVAMSLMSFVGIELRP
jgi:hypothetical protein